MSDPKKAEMQTEMMALYKSEGVNMYGSCLPMLIQMPLLYAIYRVLAHADELRQAHSFWISDLASPDPLHILPIFIIASMSLTQFITPQPGMDAAQRRIMAFLLPITMGFMMWRLPAGLSLYWGPATSSALPSSSSSINPRQAKRCTPSPPTAFRSLRAHEEKVKCRF